MAWRTESQPGEVVDVSIAVSPLGVIIVSLDHIDPDAKPRQMSRESSSENLEALDKVDTTDLPIVERRASGGPATSSGGGGTSLPVATTATTPSSLNASNIMPLDVRRVRDIRYQQQQAQQSRLLRHGGLRLGRGTGNGGSNHSSRAPSECGDYGDDDQADISSTGGWTDEQSVDGSVDYEYEYGSEEDDVDDDEVAAAESERLPPNDSTPVAASGAAGGGVGGLELKRSTSRRTPAPRDFDEIEDNFSELLRSQRHAAAVAAYHRRPSISGGVLSSAASVTAAATAAALAEKASLPGGNPSLGRGASSGGSGSESDRDERTFSGPDAATATASTRRADPLITSSSSSTASSSSSSSTTMVSSATATGSSTPTESKRLLTVKSHHPHTPRQHRSRTVTPIGSNDAATLAGASSSSASRSKWRGISGHIAIFVRFLLHRQSPQPLWVLLSIYS
jgi:hypothetical protein